MVSIYPFLVGAQIALVDNFEGSKKFFFIILAIFLGCYFERRHKKMKSEYTIKINPKNTKTHIMPYKSAVFFVLSVVLLFFFVKGIPLFDSSPDIAKVTVTGGGGWIFTRFIRYF
jgi:hypothetical protein